MAAVCVIGEEEVWKCPKHPSRRRKNGVCATCLRDRLLILCPNCAQLHPCPCTLLNSNSSASSSSSTAAVAKSSSLRRSRSIAIPFHRPDRNKTPSFLAVFTRTSTKRSHEPAKANDEEENSESNERILDFAKMITRSRSVRTPSSTTVRGGSTAAKAKFWRFPLKFLRS